MLVSLVALVEAEEGGQLPQTHGELMQGALLRRASALGRPVANALHGGNHSAPRP